MPRWKARPFKASETVLPELKAAKNPFLLYLKVLSLTFMSILKCLAENLYSCLTRKGPSQSLGF